MTDIDLASFAATRAGSPCLRGYLATPAGAGPWPGVVVLHEGFGLTEAMRWHADRLAGFGYLALAVDLYTDGPKARCMIATMRAMHRGHGRAFADIAAARDYLIGRDDCTGKTGVIGFCLGGSFALLTASNGFDAASVNYGPLPKDLDAALVGACPVVASYGAKDPTLRGAASKLDAALEKTGVVYDLKEYPAASHAFLNDVDAGPRLLQPLVRVTGMGPEPESARDAWNRIEIFFAAYLR
ncbi:dienelactone hydrolase family protein [Mycolicibacterium wolinskyi]|uniref:Carboxymethylenebutenolidase n=1 Tax=Mycolicibacterium wolinskyi TaxID=59750 RepID=A0A1X2FEI3_9MYCO|nr:MULTISPECIES: dienelactone hydrolase family protein [Mycolicibacterium]MCV7290514.1 dienelactone hydrolase family protein [Mycolicibacterium wolinskyi]MCV7291564.1 dienelactone hydrolase family protein [Mycolicibacterium goodii]ORX16855.1 carboxymethylenebutenolidase [Mycolicibacterium wolinskyi]